MAKIILEPVFGAALNNMENASSFHVLSWTPLICIRDVFHDLSHEWAISAVTQFLLKRTQFQSNHPNGIPHVLHSLHPPGSQGNPADPAANLHASTGKDNEVVCSRINVSAGKGCKYFCTSELVSLWYGKHSFKILDFLRHTRAESLFPLASACRRGNPSL